MAPIPSRRRRQQAAPAREEIPESIFDALNMNTQMNPDANAQGASQSQVSKSDNQRKPTGPSLEDLQKQIAALGERAEAAERATLALTSTVKTEVALVEPALNMDGLPDPVMYPKEYSAELGKRTVAYTTAVGEFHNAKQARVNDQAGNSQQLWEDFTERYGAYAEDQEGMEFIVNKVTAKAQRQGLDIQRYKFQNPDRFFRDVVKAYDERFGKPEGEVDEPVRERATQRSDRGTQRRGVEREPDDMQDEGRTSGIFGGIDSSGGNRAPKAPPPGDMIKDLQDIQRRTGYY